MSRRNRLSDTQQLPVIEPVQQVDTGQFRRASWQANLPADDRGIQQMQQQNIIPYTEQAPPPQRQRRTRRRRKKRGCLSRMLASLLFLLLVVFGIYSGVVLLAVRQVRHEETGQRNLTADYAEPDEKVRNILLIGTDARGDEQGRADTVIILSFSSHNQTITLTSLLRDSYVSIPGHGTNKLNAAYAYGGPTLLMDTIVNNFGIPVDDYISVNFKAVVHLVDALGGVTVTVSDREATAINMILQAELNEIMGDDKNADMLPSGGTFTLNGKQAVAYSRIRKVGNADFERTQRQRNILSMILQKLRTMKPEGVKKILYDALPQVHSNMTDGQMYLLALQTPVNLLRYQQQELRLPADGLFTDQTSPDGQAVLAVDFDSNLQLYLKAVKDPVVKQDSAE